MLLLLLLLLLPGWGAGLGGWALSVEGCLQETKQGQGGGVGGGRSVPGGLVLDQLGYCRGGSIWGLLWRVSLSGLLNDIIDIIMMTMMSILVSN